MSGRILLGMLTPSSNTALEPLTSAMVSGLPEVSVHFSRFPVTEISLDERALGQFDDTKILNAARLLADAKVDVIVWNGTAAGWRGFETDEQLCRRITQRTGTPATTAILALNEILDRTGTRTVGLISPYLRAVQDKIVANYQAAGIGVVAQRHLGISVNFDFSEVTEDQLCTMAHEVAAAKPDAIITYCTNLRSPQLAERLERETGIPFYDAMSAAVWKSLDMAGADPARVQGWGSLFEKMK